jgi:hypothetical protein
MPKDINLTAFAGPQDNGRTVVLGDITPGPGEASGIKCTSAVADITITAERVGSGRDACFDANDHTRNVKVRIKEAAPVGQFVSTVKGASVGTEITVDKILSRGKVCEHIYGDISDQGGAEWSRPGVLNSRMADGSKVRVIVLSSFFPPVAPGSGPYRYMIVQPWFPLWLHQLIAWGFRTLRNWGFFRKESNAAPPAPALAT